MNRDEGGSVHPLLAAATLVLVLGVLAVHDLAAQVLAAWNTMEAADQAALAGAQALDEDHLLATDGGEVRLDPVRAVDLAAAEVRFPYRLARLDVDGATAVATVENTAPTRHTFLLRRVERVLRVTVNATLELGSTGGPP